MTTKKPLLFLWIIVVPLMLGAADTHAGPVAWWKAEGNAADSAGGAHGVLEGVTFVPGKAGQAFQFSGSNSSVRIPDTSSLDLTNNWTLAAWVYTTSLSGHKGGGQGVVSKVGGPGGNNGYQFVIHDGTGEVALAFNQAGQGWPGFTLNAGKVPLNTWTCIAGSYDNNTMAIYVNGTLAGSRTIGPKSVANSSSNFRIGLDDNGNVNFSGMIDEVRVYNHALSSDEIRGLCPAVPDTSPVAWWKAEGNAADSAGGANGVLEGVTFVPGKAGQAFQFSGSNSSVRIPDTSSLDLTNNWTLAAWVYTTSLSGHKGGGQGVVSKVGGPGGNNGYQFAIHDGTGEVALAFNQAGQGWPGFTLNAGKVPLNTWTCIAGSYDNNTMAIYVNGTLAGSRTIGPKSVANSPSNFRIGLDDNGNVNFSGMIDEVRVYKHALSSDEIRGLCPTVP